MTDIINGLEPGMAFALGALLSAAIVIAFVSVGMAWDVTRDRSQESLSERHDRLDAEARVGTSRPTSSSRKAGRTGVQR